MKGTTLTSVESAADRGDDDLKSQESAHAIQHRAIFIIDTMKSDGMDRYEKSMLTPGRVGLVEWELHTRTCSQEDCSAYRFEEEKPLTGLEGRGGGD
jgi:hypothetical protein